jgi:hypothetical protein
VNTQKNAFEAKKQDLNTLISFLKITNKARYDDIFTKCDTKYKQLLTSVNTLFTFSSQPNETDYKAKIGVLDKIFAELNTKTDELITKKNTKKMNENLITTIDKNKTNMYNFFETDIIKSKINDIKDLYDPAKITSIDDLILNYDTILMNNVVVEFINIIQIYYYNNNSSITEYIEFIAIKKIYNKKQQYISLLTSLNTDFKKNFKKIDIFINKIYEAYKLSFIILKYFMNYVKPNNVFNNDKIKEVTDINITNPKELESTTKVFDLLNTFMDKNIIYNKIIITQKEKTEFEKVFTTVNDLKSELKQFFENLVKIIKELNIIITELSTYFENLDKSAFNNLYTITMWDKDKKIIESKTPKDAEIKSLTDDINNIFTKTLNSKHTEMHESLEEFIEKAMENAEIIKDNPDITSSSSSTPTPKGYTPSYPPRGSKPSYPPRGKPTGKPFPKGSK